MLGWRRDLQISWCAEDMSLLIPLVLSRNEACITASSGTHRWLVKSTSYSSRTWNRRAAFPAQLPFPDSFQRSICWPSETCQGSDYSELENQCIGNAGLWYTSTIFIYSSESASESFSYSPQLPFDAKEPHPSTLLRIKRHSESNLQTHIIELDRFRSS